MKIPRVVTQNPFEFANDLKPLMPPRHRPEAVFEKRARIRFQIDMLDGDIKRAIKRRRFGKLAELTEKRNALVRQLP